MKSSPLASRNVAVFFAIGLAFSVSGCSDPAFHAKMAVRLGHLEAIDKKVWAMERKRPENLKQVDQTIRTTEARYHQRLVDTVAFIDRKCAEDFHDWVEDEPRRVSRLARLWNGKPEKIAPTYRGLAY